MSKLLTTAKRPEPDCLARRAVACVQVRAIGVKRLTGNDSEAISKATESAVEQTALQLWQQDVSDPGFTAADPVLYFDKRFIELELQERLDCPAFIHRAIPLGDLIKWKHQVEHFPRIDLLVQHQID
jgi:hypothetical protein